MYEGEWTDTARGKVGLGSGPHSSQAMPPLYGRYSRWQWGTLRDAAAVLVLGRDWRRSATTPNRFGSDTESRLESWSWSCHSPAAGPWGSMKALETCSGGEVGASVTSWHSLKVSWIVEENFVPKLQCLA